MLLAAFVPLLLLVSKDPAADPLSTAFNNLKAAEEQKDTDQIKKFAVESSQFAREAIKAPEPKDADEVTAWKARVDYAHQVENYAAYALYVAAIQAGNRDKLMDLGETLFEQAPASEYAPKLYSAYLAALTESGKSAKAFPFAEKAIAHAPGNEDVLLVLANGCMTRKQWDRAATYGVKLASVMSSHGAPEGVSAGDWERKKTAMLGRGYWIAGMSYASANKFPAADKNLRAALPYIKGESQLMGGALFYLGVANYNLARATHDRLMMKEALAFSEQAAAIPGSYQQLAGQNVYAIKNEMTRLR